MKALPLCLLATASIAKATFWLEQITHQGISPFNSDPTYKVFRNVKDYGAKGDGVTDDTAAINAAISSGSRCGGLNGCVGSTTSSAVVYFPAGTYIISSSIIDFYYTQIIGDPTDMPVIKASAAFPVGSLGLLDSDQYTDSGQLQFKSQNVFYRQVRNLVFDTRAINGAVNAIHWPAAQATSIQNCVFYLSPDPSNNHTGIFVEEGSGGMMSDLVFYGGTYGGRFGSQQYTMRNLTFTDTDTAILQIWNWGWTYKSLSINNCRVGIDMSSSDVGSVTLLDSIFTNVTIAMITGRNDTTGRGSLFVENVKYNHVPVVLMGSDNKAILLGDPATGVFDGGSARGNLYAPYGPVLYDGRDPAYFNQPPALKNGYTYFEMPKPRYEAWDVSKVQSARSFGAVGDGKMDDTAALNLIFSSSARNNTLAFLDAGNYLVTDTVYIPGGARIVGEGLAAVILGVGAKFSDINNPHPVLQIGTAEEQGIVEISDLIVSTQGATTGAVLIEYNLHSPSAEGSSMKSGSCNRRDTANMPSGLWDVHVRIGGFAGSQLQVEQCPTTPHQTDYVNPSCIAAYMSMHITPTAKNLYMENNWLWTADHDIEDGNATQVSVFAGRGMLIDHADSIWLVGSAVEHHTLYQYQIVNSTNIFIGQAQTETPYYQPNPPAPAPFTQLNKAIYDPDFGFDCSSTTHFNETVVHGSLSDTGAPCNMAWGLRILGSSNIVGFGVGLYSFFNNYDTSCSKVTSGENCQARIFWIGPVLEDRQVAGGGLGANNSSSTANGTRFGGEVDVDMSSIEVYNLATVGSVSMVTRMGNDVAEWVQNAATFAATLAIFQF